MRTIHLNYTFDASSSLITLSGLSGGGDIVPERMLGIWNATRKAKLYDPHVPGFGGTFATNTLTLTDVDTSGHADTDVLLIFYEQDTMPMSAATLPLPTGAATEATLAELADAIRHEDEASANGDPGFMLLVRRVDSPAASSGTTGDYESLQSRDGRLFVRAAVDDALPVGSNTIGRTYDAPQASKALLNANVNVSSSGNNTVVAGSPGQTIRVFRGCFVAEGDVTLSFYNRTGGTLLATVPLAAGGTFSFDCLPGGEPLWVTTSGGAFVLSLSAAVAVKGFIQYTQS